VSVSLSKGGNVSLSKQAPGLTAVVVGLGWDPRTTTGADFDLDASAIMLDMSGRVLSDGHFVFFNNLKSPDGSVEHMGDNLTGGAEGDDEQIKVNLTGLPAYPNLNEAKMDAVARTDKMGHWCTRFAAATSDPLDVVEAWYRKSLVNASETDLNNDERYRNYFQLTGIKLALGIDYVTVFRTGDRSSTSIELFRCSAPG